MAPRQPLRLVHASDLRIDRPLYGLAGAPDAMRTRLRDAPLEAADRVFDCVLTENADALLLSGDVIDLRACAPRELVFLVERFKRLENHGVPVFWAGGRLDPPSAWPRSTPLPENVTVFPAGRVDTHPLVRNGQTIAVVQGVSRPEDAEIDASGFHRDAHGNFTVGVAYGTSDAAGKEGDRVDYMALGGRVRRATVDHEPGVAHFAGSPQGRNPREAGPSGCTVVQVDEEGKTKTRFVATDSIRWAEESLEFTAGTTADQLKSRLRERLDKLVAKTKGVDLLVTWRLHGAGPLVVELREEGLAGELLADLQGRTNLNSQYCWSYALACHDPYEPPLELLDQETILGDLLRQTGVLRRNEAFVLDLGDMLPKPLPDPSLADFAKDRDHEERDDLYNRAAKLGVALMTEGER
ncbi:putative metallophosphoesterase YhaO [Pseudobythopirellula maris]|uniref:Putative metallophosphoesterase YhaO n=1 Tax=Pseudobythopirellula maris TaxID=2527991 RepID=A0A5C5ZN50_9BACT|nr:hypothetical protein [Pseudobythopirellula maris]TWT88526.1 putative metallophosphoesterase YhaO [Pseudobythopirellula maris]